MEIKDNSIAVLSTRFYQNDMNKLELSNIDSKERSKNDQGILLSISTDSREKLEQDQKALGEEAIKSVDEKSTNSASTDEDAEDPLDEIIKQLKEQIKDLKEKLQDIKYDDSVAADNQRKILDAELISLNGALLYVIGKKFEALKSA